MTKAFNINFPFQFFVVGGAVRDFLRGIDPKDIDIVAPVHPETLIEIGANPVDPKTTIPVFVLTVDDKRIEIALPRRERKVATGYKGFTFEFGPDIPIEVDLARRDFTINAMAIDNNGNIIDPFGGRKDLEDRILRHVSETTFVEDPLRVLRACRFAAKGFRVHPETLRLMNSISEAEFRALPVERFTAEMMKALAEAHPERFFEVLVQVPVACRVFFPELLRMTEVPAGPVSEHHPEGETVFDHTMKVMKSCSTPESRFAALLHDIGKIATPESEWPRHHRHDKSGVEIINRLKERMKGVPARFFEIALVVVSEHMKVKNSLRPGKLLKIAERVVSMRCDREFVDVCMADNTDMAQFEIAVTIAKIPAREIIPIERLRQLGKKTADVVFQKKVEIFKNKKGVR